jgi:acetylglutamate kinase
VKRLVVKLGGHALDSLSPDSPVLVELAQDVSDLRAAGTDVVLVHGGGPQIAELLGSVGVESRFHEGLRVTDAQCMEYVAMALSRVNLHLCAALNQAGLASCGVSGVDAGLFSATSIGSPWDRVGSVPKVRCEVVSALWTAGLTPVVSPVTMDEHGELLNCNADTAAGALAAALGAPTLVLLSDIDQLRSDPDDEASALASVTSTQVRSLIASGAAREGMRPKMSAALDALAGGAQRILMANGTRAHALRGALEASIPTTEVVQ